MTSGLAPHFVAGQARDTLRSATRTVHERLHHHAAFADLLVGRIDKSSYRRLLAALYGFHAPLEAALLAGFDKWPLAIDMRARRRISRLRYDLFSLGLDREQVGLLPHSKFPRFTSVGAVLGALYVRDGAAIGGRMMARMLDPLLGPRKRVGRLFLAGAPRDAGLWQETCEAIEKAALNGHLAEMVCGARETFAQFETWIGNAGSDTPQEDLEWPA